MDLSKLYQKELSYENSLGQTNINTFTGRVLFKMLDMNFNVDANNLNVLHVYNSNYTYLGFRGQPYGKKWKLNCEQFLYLEDNKYVYEDENGMYVYFEHLTDNRYYDTSGLNYILTIYDNYQELKDPSGKIRKFEDNRLKEVYYEGGTFKKIIEYQNGLLLNIKNTKDPEKLIEFNYKNFLLKEVFFKVAGNIVYSLKYFYNENKELIKVNKCVKDVEKTIALFKYDNEKIKYIISLYDKTGLKIEYTNGKATKLSNIEVTISETKHEVSKRIGEMDEFLGEDIYLGDYEVLIKKSFDDSTSNYNVLSYDNFEYITNGLTIQNSKGLKQVLYYDNLGKPISNFEYVTDLTNLKEINMNYGLNMLRGGGYSDKINRRTGVEITKTDNSIKNKNVTFFNNFKTLLNNKYKYNGGEINQLVCSFYIKLLAPITSNIITISFEYASYTKSAYSFIDNNLVGVWQYISIPITIEGYEFTDVKILGLQGEEKIYLNYMKLNVAPESNINIIYNGIKVNLKDVIGIAYLDKNNKITNITFSKENYLSIMDLINMKFYKIINNTNEKLLSYNNGQKKLIFNNAILRLDNKDNKYDVDFIEINDIDFNIEQKNLFNSQEIITRYSLYDDTNIIEETTYKDLNDESNSKTYYKKYDFNFNLLREGDTLLEKDEELFSLTTPYRIVVYEYDENKNLKSKAIQWPCSLGGNEVKEEKTFDKNVISVLETNRKYYSEDKTTENNSKTNYYYGNDNALLKVEKIHDVEENKIIETQNYKYDYYNENVIEVNNNQDKHNYVLYNNRGLPFYYSSNNINSNDQSKFYYSFEYEDEGNLKIQRVYLNSYTTNFNLPIKTLLFTNTYDRINNTIEIVRKDNNNNHSKKYQYDKYDRITEVLVNGESKVQFQYDDDDYELQESIKTSYTTVHDLEFGITEKHEIATQGLSAKYTYYPLQNSEVSDALSDYENCGYLLTKKSDNVRIIYGDSQIGFDKAQFKDVNLDNSSDYEEIGYRELYAEVVYKDSSSSDAKLLSMEGYFKNNIVYRNEYEYDPLSRLTKKIIKNKNYEANSSNFNIINENYEYHDFSNRLKTLSAYGNIEVLNDNVCLLSSNLTYDEFGRIFENEIFGFDNISYFKYKYQYDNNDQLIKEEVDKTVLSVIENQSREYSYSENGSILEEKIYENSTLQETKTFQYDGAKLREINCTLNNNPGTKNTLMSYDEYGNCTEIKEYLLLGEKEDLLKHTTLSWNDGKLVEYVNDDINISYEYNNINGTRYIKTIQKGSETKTIKYYYDGNKLIKEERENYNISYFYDERGVAGLTIYNDDEKDTYYFLRNYDNSIVGIVDDTNLIVAEYSCSAYGECTMHYVNDESNEEAKNLYVYDGEFIGDINPFRYKGYYYDVETGLSLVSSRYYSPELCRFIQPADVSSLNPHSINGLNLYCYANNNPIRSTVLNSYNFNTTSNYVAFANNFVKTDINIAGIENKNNWFITYRGVPVFVIPNSNLASFSFGFIFLEHDDIGDDQVLNHEWGHTRQMLLLGVGDFFNMIALPSLICAGLSFSLESGNFFDANYYKFPWEITADMFGGVTRPEHTDTAKGLGVAYLATSEFVSNAIVKPMMLPVYTTAAALLDGVIPGLGTTLLAIMYTS